LEGRWEYVWIGEFGERESYRWNNVNETGNTTLNGLRKKELQQ